MKKILIRAAADPTDAYSAEDMFVKDRTGYNNGNLAYQFSMYRTLTSENVQVEKDHFSSYIGLADKINEDYDAYVLPLADAFREDF